jgi:AcrR family transcriptional regulator
MDAIKSRSAGRRRERTLVLATRELFDEHGLHAVPIERVARAAGIARGLVYRTFSSKEELFILTVTTYLAELDERLAEAVAEDEDPAAQLERCAGTYAAYCQEFPAFLDCSISLMQRPAAQLQDIVSESVWFRLGHGMGRCLDHLAGALRRGNESGAFSLADTDYHANLMWSQMLGAMHFARLGVGVRQLGPGVPGTFHVDAERVVASCVRAAMASVTAEASGAAAASRPPRAA